MAEPALARDERQPFGTRWARAKGKVQATIRLKLGAAREPVELVHDVVSMLLALLQFGCGADLHAHSRGRLPCASSILGFTVTFMSVCCHLGFSCGPTQRTGG
jgi:hypothetical protein